MGTVLLVVGGDWRAIASELTRRGHTVLGVETEEQARKLLAESEKLGVALRRLSQVVGAPKTALIEEKKVLIPVRGACYGSSRSRAGRAARWH